MKNAIKAVAAGIGAAALLMTGVSASQAVNPCPTARVCLWTDSDMGGTKMTTPWATLNVGNTMNDHISSYLIGPASNPASPYLYFYEHANYGGANFYDKANNGWMDLRLLNFPGGGSWNDKISSTWG